MIKDYSYWPDRFVPDFVRERREKFLLKNAPKIGKMGVWRCISCAPYGEKIMVAMDIGDHYFKTTKPVLAVGKFHPREWRDAKTGKELDFVPEFWRYRTLAERQ